MRSKFFSTLAALLLFPLFATASGQNLSAPSCDYLRPHFGKVQKTAGSKIQMWNETYTSAKSSITAFKALCTQYATGSDQQKSAIVKELTQARNNMGYDVKDLEQETRELTELSETTVLDLSNLRETKKPSCASQLNQIPKLAKTGLDQIKKALEGSPAACNPAPAH